MATQGASDVVEKKIADHLTGKTAYTSPGPLYVALTTVAVAETDTGTTITEPGTTGYARVQVPTASWNAASGSGTTPSSAVTNALIQSGALSGSNATVIGYALCSASTLGDVVAFGTTASLVIGPANTPWQIQAGNLSLSVD